LFSRYENSGDIATPWSAHYTHTNQQPPYCVMGTRKVQIQKRKGILLYLVGTNLGPVKKQGTGR